MNSTIKPSLIIRFLTSSNLNECQQPTATSHLFMIKNGIKAKRQEYKFSLRLTCPTKARVSYTRSPKHFPDSSFLVLLPAKFQIICSLSQLRTQRFKLSTKGASVSTDELAVCTERVLCLYGIACFLYERGRCLHRRACHMYGRF